MNGLTNKSRWLLAVGLAVLVAPGTVLASTEAADALGKVSSWKPPAFDEVRADVLAWLEKQNLDDQTRAQAQGLWAKAEDNPTATELLVRLAETFGRVDQKARQLAEVCSAPRDVLVLPEQEWLVSEETPPLVANNLRLLFGRWLVHEELYEDAVEQLDGLEPADVVDPATLLFYRSVAHFQLVDRKSGVKSLDRLLEGSAHCPRRYSMLATLMQEDLKALKDGSLGHIARRMKDIKVRLGHGHAGPKVIKVEKEVVEALDKLIEELEKQQQQQSGAAGGDNIQSSRPAQDSVPIGGKGPGETIRRKLGSKAGWGDLPPKERQEALQQFGKDFPAHYRDVIEQYFRKLAEGGR